MKSSDMYKNLKNGITLYRIVMVEGVPKKFEIRPTKKNLDRFVKILDKPIANIWAELGEQMEA